MRKHLMTFSITLKNITNNELKEFKVSEYFGGDDEEYFKAWDFALNSAKEMLLNMPLEWGIVSIVACND